MLETVNITVDGSPMAMFVATPDGAGKHPGILLSHHQNGLSPFTRMTAENLAKEGFVVVAPDHYHHTSPDLDLAARKAQLLDTQIIADMLAATEYLRAHTRVKSDATAIMGHCMGGRHTLLGAATVQGFRCGAVFYGGGVMTSRGPGPTVFERLSGVHCPIAGFFGAKDKNPSPADVRKIEAELMKLGVACDFRIYDDTDHGFMDPTMGPPKYMEKSAKDAWTRSLAFLRQHVAAPEHVA
jgi:carboxymethylenebutenolidase